MAQHRCWFVLLTALAALSMSGGATAGPARRQPDGPVLVGDRQMGVTLGAGRHYALAGVWVGGVEFRGSGAFPCFTLFDPTGKEEHLPAGEPGWRTRCRLLAGGATVTYARPGFRANVNYRVGKSMVTVTVTPTEETGLKVRMVSDSRLVSIPSTSLGATSTGFLVKPHCSGELIRFPGSQEEREVSEAQSWTYQASFFGLGCNGRGLIVRYPRYGAFWTAGTGNVAGVYSLYGGLAADFRPRHDNPATTTYPFWQMPLVEPKVEIQLVGVGDTNGDGEFNWVDIAVAYRDRFIRRNRHLDRSELASIGGKIDIGDQFEGNRDYRQLIEQLRTINFAPQRWWLVGAHTAPGHHFCDPPYTERPDPSHDGPRGYGYFEFKRDAAQLGVKIGLHEMFQDISPSNGEGWEATPMKHYEDGQKGATFAGVHNGKDWIDYGKALNAMLRDGSFIRQLDEHLRDWDVRRGDTWHWDVLTAQGGSSDFSLDHPATHGSDIRARIEVLKHLERAGVYMTSEGLQEGLSEYCDFSYVGQADPLFKSQFAAGEVVPLLPVLFQGKAYYAPGWGGPAWTLLHGAKAQGEGVAPADRVACLEQYFGSVVFWAIVADRTVANMTRTAKGWKVAYTQGGSLSVDLTDPGAAGGFVLEIDGKTYTPQSPPPSAWGVTATWVDGKRVLAYPNRKRGSRPVP